MQEDEKNKIENEKEAQKPFPEMPPAAIKKENTDQPEPEKESAKNSK